MNNRFCIPVLVFMTLAVFISCTKDSSTQPKKQDLLAADLQEALDTGAAQYGGKGFAASVLIPGEEPWLGVTGISHGTTAISEQMLFAAGSVTKNFTAALICQLAEEGSITLDDPIHIWLQEFQNIDNSITIRQLLNHTSGIFNFTEHPDIWNSFFTNPDCFWTQEEILQNFVLPPYFSPGSNWHYSNTGYLLLGMIIEVATGSSISAEFRTRFWTPLGMTQTYLAGEETLEGDMAHGWLDIDNDGDYDDLSSLSMRAFYSAASTAGAVFSTAPDLARWAQALFLEKIVVTQSSLDEMLTFYSPIPDQPILDGYGLGTILYTPEFFNDLEMIGHSGDAPGYAAGSLFLPEYGVCIGLTDNTEQGNSMPIFNDILTIIVDYLNP